MLKIPALLKERGGDGLTSSSCSCWTVLAAATIAVSVNKWQCYAEQQLPLYGLDGNGLEAQEEVQR